MNKKKRLLIFGFGYTSKFMCHKLAKKNWQVFCTTRFSEKFEEIQSINATPIDFNDEEKIQLDEISTKIISSLELLIEKKLDLFSSKINN